MELDFSENWRLVRPRLDDRGEGLDSDAPEAFAASELAAILGKMGCRISPVDEADASEGLIVLDAGHSPVGAQVLPASGGRRRAPFFAWRAAPNRVEIYGEDGGALLRGAYSFLDALGVRWVEPGEEGERLPRGPVLDLAESSRRADSSSVSATLILGHGAFLERWEEYFLWAARVGYSSIFIHTSPDALALGAAPESLYETLRSSVAAAARRLGLVLELGGHGLSALVPRALFRTEPELFRMSEGGERASDRNFCPSSGRALSLASEAFAARSAAHPEVSVFHVWPDDLPGGGWCSCPACASLSPAAQSLEAARALAAALARARPDAALSFLAYHDTEGIGEVLEGRLESEPTLPPNLELLWAPRLRSWGSALNDGANALNAASLADFRRTAKAWRASGGGRVAIFEYWEDAVLFKTAVPPLPTVIEGDLAAYGMGAGDGEARAEAADAIGLLCTGGRLPLAPRPNAYLLPRLAASARPRSDEGPRAQALLAEWASAAYGPSAAPMLEYWRELESAWAIDLDIGEGDCAVHMPDSASRYASDPPVDWGDPWIAGAERLAYRRGRCEELFDHLRRAESMLSEAREPISEGAAGRAVAREAAEYAISGSLLELDCARLAVYHELAAGDPRAAADIANLALSASSAVRKAFSRLPDRRARREMGLLILVFYDLRLRAIRRANARSGLRRLSDLWYTQALTLLASRPLSRAYEARGIASSTRRH